ncbi:MAG TPA: type II secretion system F family protein [Acidobacteriaceae bacterium]|nr:type II secretion system F family protein [Acidobacteriaceae bacterium]
MLIVIILVFLGVFSISALLLIATGTGASQATKRTLTVLHAALSAADPTPPDPIVDVRKQELFSALPSLNRILLKLELAPRLRLLLYQADLRWTAGSLILMSLTACFIPIYIIHWRTGSALLAMLVGIVTGCIPFFFVLFKRSRRFAKFEQQLPEALDLMVNAMRAGHSLNSSLELIAHEMQDPLGGEFRICFDEQNYGLELKTAMNNLVSRVPLQDLKMVVTAILIQKESGGNLAEVLDKVSYVIRERFRLKRQVRVHTAQGRLTGWILSFLPLVLGCALYMINAKGISLLWHRQIGIDMLYAAGISNVIGALIIRKIVNMEV